MSIFASGSHGTRGENCTRICSLGPSRVLYYHHASKTLDRATGIAPACSEFVAQSLIYSATRGLGHGDGTSTRI